MEPITALLVVINYFALAQNSPALVVGQVFLNKKTKIAWSIKRIIPSGWKESKRFAEDAAGT